MNLKSAQLAFLIFAFSANWAFSQNKILDVGGRFQKSINLYLENGISFEYSDPELLSDRLYLGFAYVSSRLGTAIGSNALKQDNFLVMSTWYFRKEHLLRPLARLNMGYFTADYENDMFNDLPNSSMLLSLEGGIGIDFKSPMKASVSLGYNAITGNGLKGPGTIFPLFVQTSVTYNVLRNK